MKNAAYTKAAAGRAEFRAELWEIALPVTLQCLLQSSFSVADQIMTGQLGSVNIAGIGLGGKFASIYSVMLAAIATAAGVMLAQYIGKRDAKGAGRSFYINLAASLILAAVFTALSLLFPAQLLSLYTDDAATVAKAAEYLKIFSLSFLPMALTAIFSAYLRCVQAADSAGVRAHRAGEGAEHDIRRHPAKRRQNRLCAGNRHDRHLGIRRAAGACRRLRAALAH